MSQVQLVELVAAHSEQLAVLGDERRRVHSSSTTAHSDSIYGCYLREEMSLERLLRMITGMRVTRVGVLTSSVFPVPRRPS